LYRCDLFFRNWGTRRKKCLDAIAMRQKVGNRFIRLNTCRRSFTQRGGLA
jgi:hypothetical protein